MPMRQARPHVAAAADVFDFCAGYVGKNYGESTQLANGSLTSLLREPVVHLDDSSRTLGGTARRDALYLLHKPARFSYHRGRPRQRGRRCRLPLRR